MFEHGRGDVVTINQYSNSCITKVLKRHLILTENCIGHIDRRPQCVSCFEYSLMFSGPTVRRLFPTQRMLEA
ncbi:hypothetical protein AN403_6057 [Pseudomonas fluorescens]|uniref:Uncharacterized protein n=1 Tax=Pseudomonas fluorescens TaxID=294 RepID=A0A0N8NY42_PSEFL|nr:hypothetical protein AN403_6057 [Pseudomonas fluorescens]